MSAVVMPDTTERKAGASPQTTARITGVVYLLFYVTVILGAVLANALAPVHGGKRATLEGAGQRDGVALLTASDRF